MPTQSLPKLPGCGRPAVNRIEIYSPRETLHGALDGSIYTCREHTDPARNAIEAAGFTAHTMPMSSAASGIKFCGDGYDFLASRAMHAPEPQDETPISPEQAVTQVIDENRSNQALLGKLARLMTDPEMSSGGKVNTATDLLVNAGIIDSGSSTAWEGGSSPDGDGVGPDQPSVTPPPARPVPPAHQEHGPGAQPECDGLCLDSADIGIPGYGVAYAHPGCPLHAPGQVCECGQPDRCMSPTHGQISMAEALTVGHRQSQQAGA